MEIEEFKGFKGFTLVESHQAIPVKTCITIITGQPGTGKSSLAMTIEDALFIAFDPGIYGAIRHDKTPILAPESWEDFAQDFYSPHFVEQIINPRGIKTIVIDTIGTMLDDFVVPYAMKQGKTKADGSLSFHGWAVVASEFSRMVSRIRELGLNLVGVCHAKEEKHKEDTVIKLAVKGGSNDIICRHADMIGMLSPNAKGDRVLDFEPSVYKVGKNRGGIAPSVFPDSKKAAFKGFYQRILIKTLEKLNSLSDSQRSTQEKIDLLSERVAYSDSKELAAVRADLTKESQLVQEQVTTIAARRYVVLLLEETNPQTAEELNALMVEFQRADGGHADVNTFMPYRRAFADGLKEKGAELGLVFVQSLKKFAVPSKESEDAAKN